MVSPNPGVMRERDIRACVRAHVEHVFAHDEDSVVVDEFGLVFGDARIDVAVVNGALHGYEIKSERDSLSRLPGQAESYGRVFDRVTLVSAPRHLERAAEIVPSWWGLLEVTNVGAGVELAPLRANALNTTVDAVAIAQLLWRDEAVAVLEARELGRGFSRKPRRELAALLASELELDELRDEVRSRLRSRPHWRTAQPPE